MGCLLVQTFLRKGGTLTDLSNKYAIKTNRSGKFPNLFLLKYNQIDSPMGDPIVQECRGLILDQADNWRVVSRSFDKFFNHGEIHAASIDWATARVQEKLDGSLCVLYHYQGEWCVQTSGQPDAAGQVGDTADTFADLFWRTWAECGYPSVLNLNTETCYAFELMTKFNRVIVIHEKPRLALIGARNRTTGEQIPVDSLSAIGWETVKSFPLQSFEDIASTFANMEPLRQEGYVVVDANFNRVKVKHPGYVAIHHLKDGHSTKRLIEIVQAGEVGEFTTYFPEWSDKFANITVAIDELSNSLQGDYDRLHGIPSQKDFAIEAVKTKCSAALFSVRAKKTDSIKSFVNSMRPEQLMSILGLREVPQEAP